MTLTQPNFNNSNDRLLYFDLMRKSDDQLIETEKRFIRSMYIQEEMRLEGGGLNERD